MGIQFTKMQAYGNDYVYVDAIHQKISEPKALAKKISDRHFGVGSDGLVLVCPSCKCDFGMRIFNPDGTEAEMCGNALRSVGKFLYYHKITTKENITIETLGGEQKVHLQIKNQMVENITAIIGKPELLAEKIRVVTEQKYFIGQSLKVQDKVFLASAVSWGNPHTVILVDDVEHFEVEKYGSFIECMDCFPERTNVTFAQVVDSSHIRIREWERGTGETLGCGTGCCSAVVILNILGKCGRVVDVKQPGGTLQVEWDSRDIVHMTGPSYVVYEGEYIDETEEIVGANAL